MTKYRPEIDGLRAIAVLPVIFFHLGYNCINGGYYGVDVFFVISGYLITSILVDKISTEKFSMYEFWIRRIKRIFPLLLTVVLTFLIILPFVIYRPSVRDISTDAIATVFSFFNIHATFNFGNYWGVKAGGSFLLHTWSLSLEEQFYLLYPFFLFLTYKFLRPVFIPVFLTITLLSFILFAIYIDRNTLYAFYLLPCRGWELLIGGAVSLITNRTIFKNTFYKNIIPFLGLLSIFTSYFLTSNISNAIGYNVIFSVLGSSTILFFCSQEDAIGQLLSSRPFVYIGKISYSLYLWHWPLIVLFRTLSHELIGYNKHIINAIILCITFILSVASYHLVENKTRNSKHTLKLVAGLIICAVSLSFFYRSEYFNIHYNSKYNQLEHYVKYYDISPSQYQFATDEHVAYNVIIPSRKDIYKNAYKEEGIITKVNGKSPELILIGDSHGVMWAKLMDDICERLKISRSFYTSDGSKPFFNLKDLNKQTSNPFYTEKERIRYAHSIVNNIEKWKPKVCIFACRWDTFNEDENARSQMEDFLDLLKSKSIKVIIFNQPPQLEFTEDCNAGQYLTYLGIDPVKGFNYLKISDNKTTIQANKYIETLKGKYDNLTIYDVYSHMSIPAKTIVSKNKDVFYFDDDHLTYQGTKYHESNIERLISALTHITQ